MFRYRRVSSSSPLFNLEAGLLFYLGLRGGQPDPASIRERKRERFFFSPASRKSDGGERESEGQNRVEDSP